MARAESVWDPPQVTHRPTDRAPSEADLELDELDGLDDPLAPRDDTMLPARRASVPERSHDSVSAVFSQCERAGQWSAADRLSAAAWFGEVKLDFRDAEIASDGVVEVDATAVFGQIILKVPRGTQVEMGGVWALFGEAGTKQATNKIGAFARKWLTGHESDEDEYEDEADEEPMILRVKGSAIFGAVTVEVG